MGRVWDGASLALSGPQFPPGKQGGCGRELEIPQFLLTGCLAVPSSQLVKLLSALSEGMGLAFAVVSCFCPLASSPALLLR